MKDIKLLYNWGLSTHANASGAAQILLSLWDGRKYRVNLQAILICDDALFNAYRTVFAQLFVNNQQLNDYVTEQEMTRLIEKWGNSFTVS